MGRIIFLGDSGSVSLFQDSLRGRGGMGSGVQSRLRAPCGARGAGWLLFRGKCSTSTHYESVVSAKSRSW